MSEYCACRLCPRSCGVNRTTEETGYCGASATVYAGRAALHQWEEPPISGTRGSGTIFFSHCTLGCVFCQNRQISGRVASGYAMTVTQLAGTFLRLEQQGAHNINLVTATHYAPHIVRALELAKGRGLNIPVVLNSGGYERVDTLAQFDGLVQIYLPDFKYYSSYYAGLYAAAPDYREVAEAAIDEMLRQTGAPKIDESGLMRRGTVIRHLMLPGLAGDTQQVLRRIADRWGDQVLVSLLRQYTPFDMEQYPSLNRRITETEYQDATAWFSALGLAGFFQDAEAVGESFIPSFDGEGLYD